MAGKTTEARRLADVLRRLTSVAARQPGDVLDQAAAMLREQSAEIERLRELLRLRGEEITRLEKEADEDDSELERLRAALERMPAPHDECPLWPGEDNPCR